MSAWFTLVSPEYFGAMLKLINVGQASVLFLDAYKESSAATVEHFELNLERALFGHQRPDQGAPQSDTLALSAKPFFGH